jgi:predicted ATPase/class 3 adenylate cyclase
VTGERARPTAERPFPTGTVTFLRTDVEGSMGLIRELGAAWDGVNASHMGIIRAAVDEHGGNVVRTEGDAMFAVFPEARAAVAAAIAAQRGLTARDWPDGIDLRVRMGLHSGEAYLAGDDYGGFEVNRAARIAAAGHGGQIVLSGTTRALVEDALPDAVSVRDLGRHVLRGLPQAEAIHQVVAPGLRSEFPALRSTAPGRGNLPERLTSFVGRERELGDVANILEAHRLVTLTGPGGIGKTSLAIEAARTIAGDISDGAWLVELDAVDDPTQFRAAIARTLGIFDGPERAAADGLLPYLTGREMLLILDNFERLVAAAPDIGQLLRGATSLRVLVTSRTPLRIAGEQEFPVEPLPNSSGSDPSIRLFGERARSVRPSFDAGAEIDVVGEVCSLLDGLPLGIELAAARVALLPVGAIRDRLASNLPLPGTANRDAPDRQRTLDAAIGWSYDLLTPERKRLLQDLSVFDGGFDLEQVEAVHDGADVLESMVDLIDQSLLFRDPDAADGIRFRQLRTIQAFALGQLRSEGREAETRQRHAVAYLDLAKRFASELPGGDQRRIIERLRMDHLNFRSALRWSIDSGELVLALALVANLWRYWQLDGHLAEGAGLAEEALAMPGAEAPTAARLAALPAAAGIAYWQGRQQDAARLYDEQLGLARRLADRVAEADATFNAIYRNYITGDFEAAAQRLQESRRLFAELGDERSLARTEWTRGTMAMNEGRNADSEPIFEGALQGFRESGDAWYESLALASLAWARFAQGDNRRAITYFLRSLMISRDLGDVATTAISLEVAAICALELHESLAAAMLLGAFETALLRYGARPPAALARLISTKEPHERLRDELDEPTMERAMTEGRRLTVDEAVALLVEIATNAGLWPPGDRAAS